MLSTGYFYHSTIRKLSIGFATIFNTIDIKRYNNNGTVLKTIRVPISFGPRHKFLARLQEDYGKSGTNIHNTLPRLSFSMGAPVFDPDRMINKLGRTSKEDTLGTLKALYNPTPYNIPFTLNLWTKHLDDSFQVVEQILATFTPELTMRIIDIPALSLKSEVPVVLDSVTMVDDYEGDFLSGRLIEWTFEFTVKGYIYPVISDTSVIKKVSALIRDLDTEETFETITNAVNPIAAFPPDVHVIDETIT